MLVVIAFSYSLNPDQNQQNVCLDLDPNHLTLILFLKDGQVELSKFCEHQIVNFYCWSALTYFVGAQKNCLIDCLLNDSKRLLNKKWLRPKCIHCLESKTKHISICSLNCFIPYIYDCTKKHVVIPKLSLKNCVHSS